MSIDYIRGFRRLGWVLIGLSVPAVSLLSYQEAYEFSGFSAERIAELYPRISGLDAEGPVNFVADLSPDQAIQVLVAERNGTIETAKRDVLAELRRRNEFPQPWEVETRRLDWFRFAGMTIMIEAAIVLLIQGGISLISWVLKGFIKEP